MADLNQVPPGLEVWSHGNVFYLVKTVPGTNPPIPLYWKVDPGEKEALGIDRADRTFGSLSEMLKTGAINHGSTRELINTTVDPWEAIQSNYRTEVKVKPWLADPEILALWTAAAFEGRSITDSELQGTEWWRTRTDAEREWVSLNASDPETANQIIRDNRLRVGDLLRQAGVANPTDSLIQTIADQWTSGQWSEIYAVNQIQQISDPQRDGELDPLLVAHQGGLDTTSEGVDVVRDMVNTWLGPKYAAGWSDDNIDRWAGRLRNDPDARMELEQALQKHRLALFPEYDNPNLSYEDIVAPWRGVWSNSLGQIADESDPLFLRMVRMNDMAGAEQLLRQEGLKRGNQKVTQDLLSDLAGAFGNNIRRADSAIL